MLEFIGNSVVFILVVLLFFAGWGTKWASAMLRDGVENRSAVLGASVALGVFGIRYIMQVLKSVELEAKVKSLEEAAIPPVTLTDGEKNAITESIQGAAKDATSVQPLSDVIGLESVKQEVQHLSHFIATQKKRKSVGLPTQRVNLHLVFTGNPGTGKTMIAREIAKIYKSYGVLEKGHLVETDRSGLVAEYLGQTAVKTKEIVQRAMGGVLFIDEAYALLDDSGNGGYGKEAIDTLLKEMEDKRDAFVVIVAGYVREMENFVNSNPGLRSRFSKTIAFPDYSSEELLQIFELTAKKSGYVISSDARNRLARWLVNDAPLGEKGFGNARFVRNLFEKTLIAQAQRVASPEVEGKEALQQITHSDIELGIASV